MKQKQITKIKMAANQCLLSTEIGLKDRLENDLERLRVELAFLGDKYTNIKQVELFRMQGFFISAAAIHLKTFVIYRLEVAVYISGVLGYIGVCSERVEEEPAKFLYNFLAVQSGEIEGLNLFNFDNEGDAIRAGLLLVKGILSGDINQLNNGN